MEAEDRSFVIWTISLLISTQKGHKITPPYRKSKIVNRNFWNGKIVNQKSSIVNFFPNGINTISSTNYEQVRKAAVDGKFGMNRPIWFWFRWLLRI